MRNHCSFTGRTTKDLDYKVLESGKRRAVFTIAVDAYSKGTEKEVDFIQIKVFDDLAQTLADKVGKGSLITVDARYKPGKYQNAGKTEYTHDFIAFNVDFQTLKPVGGVQDGNNQPMYGQQNGQPYINNGQQNFGPGNNGGQPPYNQPQLGGQPQQQYSDQPSYGNNNNQSTYPNFPNQPPNNYPNPYER